MDRYTKTILTVIAIALMWIGIRDLSLVSNAFAGQGIVEVKVIEMDINRYRPIPVEVQGKITCKE